MGKSTFILWLLYKIWSDAKMKNETVPSIVVVDRDGNRNLLRQDGYTIYNPILTGIYRRIQEDNNGNEKLKVGDSVFFRHAKAGEICEHFDKIILLKNDGVQGYALTYRGEGKTFI